MENIDWLAWSAAIVTPALVLVTYFATRSDFRKLIKRLDNLCKGMEGLIKNIAGRH